MKLNVSQRPLALETPSFAIRYLGLALCTRKLWHEDCDPLLHKVESRMNSWSAKTLSFAGRLQLLNSVIAGITTFWCSALILPKKVIKTLTSLCNAFLLEIELWDGVCKAVHYVYSVERELKVEIISTSDAISAGSSGKGSAFQGLDSVASNSLRFAWLKDLDQNATHRLTSHRLPDMDPKKRASPSTDI